MVKNYYMYSQKHKTVNGKVIEDTSEKIEFQNEKGRKTRKNKGKIVEDVEISRKDFEKYLKSTNNHIRITPAIFNNAFNLLSDFLILEELEKPKKEITDTQLPSDLLPGTKIKPNKLSKSEKNVCDDIIESFGLDPSTATKEEIKLVYKGLSDMLEKKCKKDECSKKLKQLSKNIAEYNNPDNNCL